MTNSANNTLARADFNNEDSNRSPNPSFDSILKARLSRRGLLRGGVGTVGTAMLGGMGLAACGGGGDDGNDTNTAAAIEKLGFQAVPKSLADAVTVPAGYTASVLYALGDPLTANTSAYKNDGTDGDFANRAGDHHDGMEYFGLSADGRPSTSATERALLAVNHEATTDERLSSFFIHADGGKTTLPRPAAEVDKEISIHGVSVVEVRKNGGKWEYLKESAFNRRLTPLTDIEIAGPARGDALLVTRYSPTGTRTRGTLNNCGTGKTPWGTFLTGEENWFGYFTRSATDDAARNNDKSVTALRRVGRTQGAASRHGWESAGPADQYARWNISKTGTSANGSDDYRNELNGMGYVVEMDAYDKSKPVKKRTGLGRMAHESASFGLPVPGQPLAVYMGDDAQREYMYKFVSTASWSAADANAADRTAVGDKYLDNGKLYVARYNADGTGQWLELSMSNTAVTGNTVYPFDNLADICVNTRLAADAAGATKMDRPEWSGVHPVNGEIYLTLTNNSNRRVEPTGTQVAPDAANPRAYTDLRGTTTLQGNVNGHLLRMKEGSGGNAATTFTWDIYLFGAEAGADKAMVNISALTADQDMSSPDGLVFSPNTGICWIQTDDGAYTDVTNCMMLAAVPGRVGDGARKTLTHARATGGPLTVTTPVGKEPTADTLKRFLVGPRGCEITGLCETPDGKTMFVNVQHPGENTAQADLGDAAKYTSQWPSNAGYGPGRRPRSATIVITRNDGGRIGS